MPAVPAIVAKRLSSEVPKYQKVLQSAFERDINEADTVLIISDMLESVFGYDKYTEVTREVAIKSTYCDLGIRIDNKVILLIEVKGISSDLKDIHLRQAINYGADSGVPWVVLTNGLDWQVHKITVDGKVTHEKFLEFNFLELSGRKKTDHETLFTLCRRAHEKDIITEVYEYRQSVNPQTIASLLMTDDLVNKTRLALRKLKPGLKVDNEEIYDIITNQIIKRDLALSDEALKSHRAVKRLITSAKKKSTKA